MERYKFGEYDEKAYFRFSAKTDIARWVWQKACRQLLEEARALNPHLLPPPGTPDADQRAAEQQLTPLLNDYVLKVAGSLGLRHILTDSYSRVHKKKDPLFTLIDYPGFPPLEEIRGRAAERLQEFAATGAKGFDEPRTDSAARDLASDDLANDYHTVSEAIRLKGSHRHSGKEIHKCFGTICNLMLVAGYDRELIDQLSDQIYAAAHIADFSRSR